MKIPKIIHQTWKTKDIPHKFKYATNSVRRYHQDWEYRLWTDEDIDIFVKKEFPDFYPIFNNFERHIMRVDVVRYLILFKIGGVYCDLDYEFLRPYNYAFHEMIFSLERDKSYGDRDCGISNAIMASRPNHPFWKLLLKEMKQNHPKTSNYLDVLMATGPGFLSTHFFKWYKEYQWDGIELTPRPVFNPHRIRGKNERKLLLNNGITHGFHLGAGTWKERWSFKYLINKLKRLFTKSAKKPQKIRD